VSVDCIGMTQDISECGLHWTGSGHKCEGVDCIRLTQDVCRCGLHQTDSGHNHVGVDRNMTQNKVLLSRINFRFIKCGNVRKGILRYTKA
jgi:hypothetical protein